MHNEGNAIPRPFRESSLEKRISLASDGVECRRTEGGERPRAHAPLLRHYSNMYSQSVRTLASVVEKLTLQNCLDKLSPGGDPQSK